MVRAGEVEVVQDPELEVGIIHGDALACEGDCDIVDVFIEHHARISADHGNPVFQLLCLLHDTSVRLICT